MSKQKRRKSPFSKYKCSVKYYMVHKFNWDNQEALDWLNTHHEYTRAMFDSACHPYETARYITASKDSYAK